MYLGKVEVQHKNLFKTPDMYMVKSKSGKPFKTKNRAITASRRIGRIKLSSKRYPIGSHIAYSAERVKVIDTRKTTGKTRLGYGFGDFY